MVPANVTVPEPAEKVPLFTQLPLTSSPAAPAMVKLAPDSMVMFLDTAPVALITGRLTVAGIVTSVVLVGTLPLHQLAPRNQSVLTEPSHLPGWQTLVTKRIPAPVVPKNASGLLVALEAVLP